MDRREVWSLHSSYKDGDTEGCGVFDSPRAMAVGLARRVHGDHQEDSRDELVDAIALAVFDMFYGMDPEDEYVSDECRDGDTVYGYEVDEVQSMGKDEKMPELKTFYFTFGCGFPLADYVQVVKAPDERTARLGMFRYYHDRWCGCYDRAEYVSEGKCAIGNVVYKVLAKVITAWDEKEIGCNDAKNVRG